MSTVKIKREPTTTTTTTTTITAAAAATAVDVQVKLEPSLSTADIKLEQHSSDIGNDIKSESDNDDGDTEQNQFTIAPKNRRQFVCKHPGCSRGFNSAGNMNMHQHEHTLQTKLNTLGKTFILTRQSINDRWPCPVPDCSTTFKTVDSVSAHIRTNHDNIVKQQQQQQHPPGQKIRLKQYFLNVDSFYVNDILCGYHTTIGLFICYECKLIPECLLTHLQQKHGYSEKSIDSSTLPDSARINGSDPSVNQHTSNSLLAAAINQPFQQHQHQDIVQGWMCVTSDCGHCGYSSINRRDHKRKTHQGKEIATVPAIVLRLVYAKTQTLCFLITRLDQASGAVPTNRNGVNRHKLDYSHNETNAQDENEDDSEHNETTDVSNHKQQWKCEYPECGHFSNSASRLSAHRREHKLEVVINIQGNTFTLSRQSLDDQWLCPVPDCKAMRKTVDGINKHIRSAHSTSTKQKRVNSDDDSNDSQQHITKRRHPSNSYLLVDNFYVNGTRCGYHNPTGLFICHACRLVPECLLTHLQQKHEFDEKSIDKTIPPESAVNAGADPNVNQQTSNPHLASAISQPSQPQHPDIVQGWLCVTFNCDYCGYTAQSKVDHKKRMHRGEQLSTFLALVLRLLYGITYSVCFLIARLDTITNNNNINPSNSTSQWNSECDEDDDDGDELVLSDYSD